MGLWVCGSVCMFVSTGWVYHLNPDTHPRHPPHPYPQSKCLLLCFGKTKLSRQKLRAAIFFSFANGLVGYGTPDFHPRHPPDPYLQSKCLLLIFVEKTLSRQKSDSRWSSEEEPPFENRRYLRCLWSDLRSVCWIVFRKASRN